MVDDCGDMSDESNTSTCRNYVGCAFDDVYTCYWDVHKPSQVTPLSSNTNIDIPLQWDPWLGETSTPNTGPFHDHTQQTKDGKN